MDTYWNNIDHPGLQITKEEAWEWLKKAKIVADWYPYHDFAGGYEHTIQFEYDGSLYELADFNGHGEQHNVITYVLHRMIKCNNQEGDGI